MTKIVAALLPNEYCKTLQAFYSHIEKSAKGHLSSSLVVVTRWPSCCCQIESSPDTHLSLIETVFSVLKLTSNNVADTFLCAKNSVYVLQYCDPIMVTQPFCSKAGWAGPGARGGMTVAGNGIGGTLL